MEPSTPRRRADGHPGYPRTTGLQAADAILDAAIDACERIMRSQELVVLLDVQRRRLAPPLRTP